MATAVVQVKRCPGCNQAKDIGEFWKDVSKRDGKCTYCKKCSTSKSMRYRRTKRGRESFNHSHKKWRESPKGKAFFSNENVRKRLWAKNKRHRLKYPEKTAARNAVRNAKGRGVLARASTLPCAHCGQQAHDYHHHKGYEPENHLEVIPLCKICHRKADAK